MNSQRRIYRRTEWDSEYEVPKYLDAQHRFRCACCGKHGSRCSAWRRSQLKSLRRNVQNHLEDLMRKADGAGQGIFSSEVVRGLVLATLDEFQVQLDRPAEAEEAVSEIVLQANPTLESMKWNVRDLADATFEKCEAHFDAENPALATPEEDDEHDEELARRRNNRGRRGVLSEREGAVLDYESAKGLLESIGPQFAATTRELREKKNYW